MEKETYSNIVHMDLVEDFETVRLIAEVYNNGGYIDSLHEEWCGIET
ncbi:hypothetical protein [Bacillus sp. Marseille-P3661]|nr:hypothetical protein [Bacillus sp. Marseille-P3661]